MNNLQIDAYETLKEKNGEQNAKMIIDYIDSTRGITEDRAKSIFVTMDGWFNVGYCLFGHRSNKTVVK